MDNWTWPDICAVKVIIHPPRLDNERIGFFQNWLNMLLLAKCKTSKIGDFIDLNATDWFLCICIFFVCRCLYFMCIAYLYCLPLCVSSISNNKNNNKNNSKNKNNSNCAVIHCVNGAKLYVLLIDAVKAFDNVVYWIT